MKTLVTYFTVSGNTQKVAEAIFEAIDEDKTIQPINEIKSLAEYDLTFVGSPMHGFGLCDEIKEFIAKYCLGKNIALFVTHAAPESAAEMLRPWLDSCKEAADEANLVGFFSCQGELSKEMADAMMELDDPQAISWGKARPSTLGKPDETRLDAARVFAREILLKTHTPDSHS